jgi:prophage regulatory protein
MPDQQHPPRAPGLRRVLRLPKVLIFSGRSRSQVYADIRKGEFPAPIALGPRASGWLEDELLAWQEQRIAEREAGTAVRSLTLRPSASPPRQQKPDVPRRRARTPFAAAPAGHRHREPSCRSRRVAAQPCGRG